MTETPQGQQVNIHLDGDGAWPDMANAPTAQLEAVARLKGGMKSGKSSVGFRIRMPDGQDVFCQTSMRIFLAIADAFRAADKLDGLEE